VHRCLLNLGHKFISLCVWVYAVGNRVNDSSRSATAALGVGTNFSAAHNQYLVGTKTVTSVNGVFNFSGNSPCSHLCKLTISHDGYIAWFAFTLCRVDSDATEHVQFQPHVHRVHCGVLDAQCAVYHHWYDMHVLSECMPMHPASVAIPSAVLGADQHHCAACSQSHLLALCLHVRDLFHASAGGIANFTFESQPGPWFLALRLITTSAGGPLLLGAYVCQFHVTSYVSRNIFVSCSTLNIFISVAATFETDSCLVWFGN